MVRCFAAQRTMLDDGTEARLFAGCWAIFGHGNVSGLGEALHGARDTLPTLRGHNEQGMALAAAFAKAANARRVMAVTTSIGPGAMNLLTAAGVTHVNRLPVLFLPGSVFADRRPDPVLQQLEDPGDATASVNQCFKPVSRFWDRITRPEQLLVSLPRAVAALTDPADCGPFTLCLCQDVQAEACDYPESFFAPRLHRPRRPGADPAELAEAAVLLRGAERPLIVAGGGVLYSGAAEVLQGFAATHRVPVAKTQAGKSAMPWDHPQAVGSIGVTGSSAANAMAGQADVVLAVGTRLHDFTTGLRAALPGRARLIQLNAAGFDAHKHGAAGLVGEWNAAVDAATAPSHLELPTDAQVLGAVNRAAGPGELHKLWRSAEPGGYHLEHGSSCIGLRDRRRPRREARPAGAGGVRDGGRRQLPDAQLQAAHLHDAGTQAGGDRVG